MCRGCSEPNRRIIPPFTPFKNEEDEAMRILASLGEPNKSSFAFREEMADKMVLDMLNEIDQGIIADINNSI